MKISHKVEPRLKKGAKIICPNPKCCAHIATAKKDIPTGSVFEMGMFTMHQAQDIYMCCEKCKTSFSRNVIHTDEGWV